MTNYIALAAITQRGRKLAEAYKAAAQKYISIITISEEAEADARDLCGDAYSLHLSGDAQEYILQEYDKAYSEGLIKRGIKPSEAYVTCYIDALRAFHKARKSFEQVGADFLRCMKHEEEAAAIERGISGKKYMSREWHMKLMYLNYSLLHVDAYFPLDKSGKPL